MLGHILYGSASLQHGNLLFTAAGPFNLGGAVTLTINPTGLSGSTITTAIANAHPQGDSADVTITCPIDCSEGALWQSLRFNPRFNQYLICSGTGGDGTPVVQNLAKTQLGNPAGGLLQALESRIGIQDWTSKQIEATGSPVALLWIAEAVPVRQNPDIDGLDFWKGVGQAGIAFQSATLDFTQQQCVLDIFRRSLYLTLKTFTHPDINDIGPVTFGYFDVQKDEAANTTGPAARCKVVGTFPIHWQEGAFDAADIAASTYPFQKFESGIFLEPLGAAVFALEFDCTTFALTVNGQTTGNLLAATASAISLQDSLESLSSVGQGNVLVTLQPDGTYGVMFGAAVQQPVAFTGTGTGGSASVVIATGVVETMPGDLAAVKDSEIDTTGL